MTLWKFLAFASSLAMTMSASALPALAQSTGAPIELVADRAEVIRSQCRSVWSGRAEATQGQTRIRAASITAHAARSGPDGCGSTTRLEAQGDVYFVSPEQVVRGARAVYQPGSGMLDVSGDVIVVQGRNVARGQHLIVNTRTGSIQMDSGSDQRVRGVFYSDSSAAPGN